MFSPAQLSSNSLKEIRKLKQKKYRKQTDCFLAEGIRLFEAALSCADIGIRELIISNKFRNSTQGDWALNNAKDRNIAVFITDDLGMKSLSEDVTPPGIVFVVENTSKNQIPYGDLEENTILYLEKISEPGNLGTILRSACWFDIKTIILSPESVEPWNPKSVRASAGAIFEVNIYTDVSYNELKTQFKKKKYNFIATVVTNGTPLDKWEIGQKNILFFGQEASGLSKDIIKDADVHINIAGFGNAESLNLSVAAGIILYEITRSE
jgi:TrmH family RNA methyltransferase